MITSRTLVGLLAIGAVGTANAFNVTVISGVPPNNHVSYTPFDEVRYDADVEFNDGTVPVVVQLEVTAGDLAAPGGIAELSIAYFNDDTIDWVGFQMILNGAAWNTLGNFVTFSPPNNPIPATITLANPQTVDIQWNIPAGGDAYTGWFQPGSGFGSGTSERFTIDVSNMQIGQTFTLEHRPVPIPEPMTLIAIGSGLAALALRRRRR